jgi:S-DNA-T family DNA segregation ATPase FtsK/SpoIIIE
LVSIDKVVYEYQAFLPFDGETESSRLEQAKLFMAGITKKYGDERARGIPEIPQILTEDYWKQGGYKFDNYVVPVALTYSEIEPVTIDLLRVGAVGVYGREGFGKTNLVGIVMKYLQQRVFDLPSKAYIIDGYNRKLSAFEGFGFVERYTVDCIEFEDIITQFRSVADARLDTLRAGGSLDNEPLLLCIVQNTQIFDADAVSREAVGTFKKLLSDAKQLRICFIFSNVDNNPDYSAPDIMKMAREFSQFFLFDDLANVRLYGSGKFGTNELRQYKKPLSVGEGFVCDSREGLEKIKVEKYDIALKVKMKR